MMHAEHECCSQRRSGRAAEMSVCCNVNARSATAGHRRHHGMPTSSGSTFFATTLRHSAVLALLLLSVTTNVSHAAPIPRLYTSSPPDIGSVDGAKHIGGNSSGSGGSPATSARGQPHNDRCRARGNTAYHAGKLAKLASRFSTSAQGSCT
eukprot:3751732-Pyramimonas_sp.AAC.1